MKENINTEQDINKEYVLNFNINSSFIDLKRYYDMILNLDKKTYKTSNDEPTPIDCVMEMVKKVPDELWQRKDLKILDPCCGNGNFFVPIFYHLLKFYDKKYILENILNFNDINDERLKNVRNVFNSGNYNLNITCNDFIKFIDKFPKIGIKLTKQNKNLYNNLIIKNK